MPQFSKAFDLLIELINNQGFEFPNAISAVLDLYT